MNDQSALLLSLVGEQPIPNLLPLWQYNNYAEVQFVASATTHKVAKLLEQALQSDPVLQGVRTLKMLRVDAYAIHNVRTQLSAAIVKHQNQGKTVHLNLTGGTKLMSLAALQSAFGSGIPLMYISTEEKAVIWLASDGSEQRRDPIRVKITVQQYLNAHGLQMDDKPVNPFASPPPKEGDELELQVLERLKESGLFDDVRRNVQVSKQNGTKIVRNELDLVVTCNGRMAVISCKSGNVDSDSGRDSYKRAIYELSAVSRREAAGIYCGKVLVSSQEVLPQSIRHRAKDYGVRIVYGAEIEQVAEHVRSALGL